MRHLRTVKKPIQRKGEPIRRSTLEIPEPLWIQLKTECAVRRESMREFVLRAVRERLDRLGKRKG